MANPLSPVQIWVSPDKKKTQDFLSCPAVRNLMIERQEKGILLLILGLILVVGKIIKSY